MGDWENRLAAGYRGNCTTCLGMGCNDCCHTGLAPANIPPWPSADIPLTLDEPRPQREERQAEQWDIKVRRVSNGFIVRGWVENDYDNDVQFTDIVLEEDPASDVRVRLLWEVIEQMGFSGNRYEAQRIYVGTKPGDKHHDYHPRPCADCECKCDPDQSTPEEKG